MDDCRVEIEAVWGTTSVVVKRADIRGLDGGLVGGHKTLGKRQMEFWGVFDVGEFLRVF